jgi:hypothetical protein
LAFNGTVFLVALTAFYKCHDRTGMFEHSFKNHPIIIQKIKERIFNELSLTLKPFFTKPRNSVIKIITDFEPGGGAWQEGHVDTQESEQYRNAIDSFLDSNVNTLAIFRKITTMEKRCRFLADYLSWSVLIVIILQGIYLIVFGVLDKMCGKCMNNCIIILLITSDILFIINCFLPLPFSLYYHKKIDTYGRKYA